MASQKVEICLKKKNHPSTSIPLLSLQKSEQHGYKITILTKLFSISSKVRSIVSIIASGNCCVRITNFKKLNDASNFASVLQLAKKICEAEIRNK